MSVDLFTTSHRLDSETGKFVSVKHQRIAEIIKDYDPSLELAFVPPERRALDEEFPFAILHRDVQGRGYVVRKVRENEMNEDLIAWLFMNDNQRNGKDLAGRLDAQDAAKKAMEYKAQMDRDAERAELAQAILRSPLHTYKHNGRKFTELGSRR